MRSIGLAAVLLSGAGWLLWEGGWGEGIHEPPLPEKMSPESRLCVSCHLQVSPGIVYDWLNSRHARVTPAEALRQPHRERRLSSSQVPEGLRERVVGCYECHGLRTEAHEDAFEHFGQRIQVVVSPKDCATCHAEEEAQYSESTKAYAHINLKANPLFDQLVHASVGKVMVERGFLRQLPASHLAQESTCYACHGTRVEVVGRRTVESPVGPVEVPQLSGWPNQGVGRINPDGSRGACTACHTRHRFDIEEARRPETCSQCHLEPDVPAYNVYRESKHGNRHFAIGTRTDRFTPVPWMVGRDFQVPTCATCHNSLLVRPDGEVVVERNHDFGSRIWVRIFGLPYSHPHPLHGDTTKIRNAEGLPLPTTLGGQPAAEFLISPQEQARRREKMEMVCRTCHSSSWTHHFFQAFEHTVRETDEMVGAATQLLQQAWQEGLADPSHPFDEDLEFRWVQQWLFYANSTRYAAAMSGPDYATFKLGWWELNRNLKEMETFLRVQRALRAAPRLRQRRER